MINKIPNLPVMGAMQMVPAITNFVQVIASYKQAIAEIDAQRYQMRLQAEIAQQQIEAELNKELVRIKHLSKNFEAVLQQNKILIKQHCQREHDVQQQCLLILQQIAMTPDLESKKVLTDVWQQLMQQMNLNREESARLQTQLMDAYQQLGISISHRDLSFKNVN